MPGTVLDPGDMSEVTPTLKEIYIIEKKYIIHDYNSSQSKIKYAIIMFMLLKFIFLCKYCMSTMDLCFQDEFTLLKHNYVKHIDYDKANLNKKQFAITQTFIFNSY